MLHVRVDGLVQIPISLVEVQFSNIFFAVENAGELVDELRIFASHA